MVRIRSASISPTLRLIGIRLKDLDPDHLKVVSSIIAAQGRVEFEGSTGQPMGGWEVGFFQFQFLETNYSNYRGRSVSHGSARIERGHRVLCRDTTGSSSGLWYSPSQVSSFGGGSVLPGPTGSLETLFADEPGQPILKTLRHPNGHTLFLHHAEVSFHFCTILVAKDPTAHYHPLKHFYWNLWVDLNFQPNTAGAPTVSRVRHSALNIQQPVRSGLPDDRRFSGHFTDRHLPTANAMARRRILPRFATDWSLT